MQLKVIYQDYHYGSVSDPKIIPLGAVIDLPHEAFPTQASIERALHKGFVEEYHETQLSVSWKTAGVNGGALNG
jgi:hypothetical protein